jgi:hypothetical protein
MAATSQPWLRLFCYDPGNCLTMQVWVLRQDGRGNYLVLRSEPGPEPFPASDTFWIRAEALAVELPPECV